MNCFDPDKPEFLKFVPFVLLCGQLFLLGACEKVPPEYEGLSIQSSWSMIFYRNREVRYVDLLLVLDTSPEMEDIKPELQTTLQQIERFVETHPNATPNALNFGIISGDLGAGIHTSIEGCEREGGDGGELGVLSGVDVAEMCIGNGQRYLVDRPPLGCTLCRFNGDCGKNPCTQKNCDMVSRPGENLLLTTNLLGGQTCRNFSGRLSEVLQCLIDVPFEGCRFFQPLNAIESVLEKSNKVPNEPDVASARFFREDAFPMISIVAGKDDCSAADPDQLYDPSFEIDNLDSLQGPFGLFRCFEWGVDCGVEDPREIGPRTQCVAGPAEEDSPQLMRTVKSYVPVIESLMNPLLRTEVYVAAGPVKEVLTVSRDSNGNPRLEPSCTLRDSEEEAAPGVRLRDFVRAVNQKENIDYYFENVCQPFFYSLLGATLSGSSSPIRYRLPVSRISGCPEGLMGTSCQVCNPRCSAWVTINMNLLDEKIYRVPWCGHVCKNGLCTVDDLTECLQVPEEEMACVCRKGDSPAVVDGVMGCAPLLYPLGAAYEHVSLNLDPRLADIIPSTEPSCIGTGCSLDTAGEASACWYLASPTSERYFSGHQIGMIREKQRAKRIQYKVNCRWVSDKETHCHDGVDNDEDCLTDEDDPDCSAHDDPDTI